jgi:flagellar biosynthesis protein FlhB
VASEKTEKPTVQRLKKAREDGQFLSSRGALGAVQFLVFVSMIGSLLAAWSERLQGVLVRIYQNALTGEMSVLDWPALLRSVWDLA